MIDFYHDNVARDEAWQLLAEVGLKEYVDIYFNLHVEEISDDGWEIEFKYMLNKEQVRSAGGSGWAAYGPFSFEPNARAILLL